MQVKLNFQFAKVLGKDNYLDNKGYNLEITKLGREAGMPCIVTGSAILIFAESA